MVGLFDRHVQRTSRQHRLPGPGKTDRLVGTARAFMVLMASLSALQLELSGIIGSSRSEASSAQDAPLLLYWLAGNCLVTSDDGRTPRIGAVGDATLSRC